MLGVPSIFLVLSLRSTSHDSSLSAIGRLANLRRVAVEVCSKATNPKLKRASRDGKGPVPLSRDEVASPPTLPYSESHAAARIDLSTPLYQRRLCPSARKVKQLCFSSSLSA